MGSYSDAIENQTGRTPAVKSGQGGELAFCGTYGMSIDHRNHVKQSSGECGSLDVSSYDERRRRLFQHLWKPYTTALPEICVWRCASYVAGRNLESGDLQEGE
jgi:hypothetical protein